MKAKCQCGICDRCKKREYDRRRYLERREEKLAQNRRWQEANQEHLREYRRDYREQNAEVLRAGKKAWYDRTREERVAKARAYYAANRKERLAAERQRYATDPAYRQRRLDVAAKAREASPEPVRAAKRRYKDRLRGAPLTPDAETLRPFLLRDPCSYCGGPAGEVDHIAPVLSGGTGDWDNLTAACRSCNASKHAKPLLGFLWEVVGDAA